MGIELVREIRFLWGMSEQLDLSRFFEDFRSAAAGEGLIETEFSRVGDDPLSLWRTADVHPALPSVYISAGIHGDEPAGTLALLDLLQSGALREVANFTLFPALNPAGLRAGTRTNADGVDLNRDYLSCSTAEVAAHVQWLRNNYRAYDLTLSLHEDWETEGFYLYEIITTEAPSLAPAILADVAPIIPLQPKGIIDGHDMVADGYIHHESTPDEPKGWPEAIFHVTLAPSRSYTFETPSALPMDLRIRAQVTAVRRALDTIGSEGKGRCG